MNTQVTLWKRWNTYQAFHVDAITRPIKVCIQCIMCDTPAWSLVNKLKAVMALLDPGGRAVFLDVNVRERTSAGFSQRSQPMHYKGVSPIENLAEGMVSQFSLNSMHVVRLGTMSPIANDVRVSAQSVVLMSLCLCKSSSVAVRDTSQTPPRQRHSVPR